MKAYSLRRAFFLMVILVLGLVSCGKMNSTSTPSEFIDEKQAIGRAQLYCAHLGEPQETPRNISARLMTCGEVGAELSFVACSKYPPEKKVWIVSMEGLWPRWRGPASIENATPAPYDHCSVMLDALTGNEMELTAQ